LKTLGNNESAGSKTAILEPKNSVQAETVKSGAYAATQQSRLEAVASVPKG
jgi:hypothetical protein